MAKGRVNKNEIVEEGLFDNAKKSAHEAEAEIELLTQSIDLLIKATAKLKKSFTGPTPQTVQGFKQFNTATKTADEAARARLQLNSQLTAAEDRNVKAKLRLTKATQDQRKALKQEIELEQSQVGSLKRLRLESKKLRDEKENVNRTTKQGKQRILEINRALDKNNAILEKNATKLGKQKIGIGRYSKALSGLRGALAQMGVAFGAFQLIRSSIDIIGDFQQATANLRSVMRDASEGEINALIKQARELGSVSRFTAGEIAGLQLEFGKLGFDPREILNMTEATQNLAAATGTELAEAASVAGGVMNAFGLASTDTEHIVDVMAASFSKSALDMEKFKETMKTAAPIARATGVSIEEATAAAGKLADANISGSKAGTDLKKIFSELVKDGKPLAESLDDISAELDGASTKAEKLAIAEGLVGDRAKAALLILVDQKDGIAELSTELENAGGTAEDMAKEQLKTLGGALDLLKSAWAEMILKMDEAGGVGEKLRNGIGFIAENLETIVKWIGKTVKFLLIYKTRLLAIKLLQSPFAKSLMDTAKGFGKSGMQAKKAAVGLRTMGKAMKGIGFGIAITLAVEFVQWLYNIVSGANAAAEAAARLDRQITKGQEGANKRSGERQDNLSKELAAQQRMKSQRLAAAKTDKERNAIEKEFLELGEKTLVQSKARITEDIRNVNIRKKAALDKLTSDKKALQAYIKSTGIAEVSFWDLANPLTSVKLGSIALEGKFKKLNQAVAQGTANIRGADERLKVYKAELEQVGEAVEDAKSETIVHAESVGRQGGAVKKINTVFKTQIDLIKELNLQMKDYLSITQSLSQERLDQQINSANIAIEEEIKNLQILADAGMDFDRTKLEELWDERKKLQIRKAEEARDAEIALEKQAFEDRFNDMVNNARTERDALLLQDGISADQRTIVEANYQAELEKIRELEKDAQINLDLEIVELKETTNGEILEIERESADETVDVKNDLNDRLTDSLIEQGKTEEKIAQEKRDKEIDKDKEQAERQRDIIKATTDYIVDQYDKRISKVQEEQDEAQDALDFFRQKAIEGNISAEESLAEEQRIIDEANQEKARLEKEKQTILLISSILQAYNSELANGATSGEAFTKAITSTTLLQTFIGSVGSFYDGTEDTGIARNGLDSNGGRVAILHNKERVMTAKQNKKVGNLSNDELANIAENHRLGRFQGADQIGSGYESQAIVDQLLNMGGKIEDVSAAIKSQESSSMEVGKLTQYAFNIMETKRKGNLVTTNTFKVGKR